VNQDSLGETGEVEGSKGNRVDSRDTTQTIAALLWHAGENHSVDKLWQGREAYVGDGLPPVPQKIVERIDKGEYIEMCELLPEFWMAPRESEESAAQRTAKSRGRRQTQDVCVWLQCFAVYVVMMSARWPKRVPEMMAYMIHIIRMSQEYEELLWFIYEEAYRRQAASTKHVE